MQHYLLTGGVLHGLLWFRHASQAKVMMRRSVNPNYFLTPEEKQRVEAAVCEAEKRTSAEIKVLLLGHCWLPLREKALSLFRKWRLDQTHERNCVLILLVIANREFLIYGDQGIHQHLRQEGWNAVRDEMAQHFAQHAFGPGLCAGIRHMADLLETCAPQTPHDQHEISNDVISEAE